MSWKNLAPTSLGDALVKHHQALEELDGIHRLIDWKPIKQQMSGVHAKKQGEQAWPPLLMFKALLLESWYGLSGPGLEKQWARDLMFRRFINLGLSEGVPDHSTIWRFRNTLTKQGLLDTPLSEVNRQLSAKGLYIKAGIEHDQLLGNPYTQPSVTNQPLNDQQKPKPPVAERPQRRRARVRCPQATLRHRQGAVFRVAPQPGWQRWPTTSSAAWPSKKR